MGTIESSQASPRSGWPERISTNGLSVTYHPGRYGLGSAAAAEFHKILDHSGVVPQESYAQASEFLANYHHARQVLEEICEINRELLRRREKL